MILSLLANQKIVVILLCLIFIPLLVSESFENTLFIMLNFRFSFQFHIFASQN